MKDIWVSCLRSPSSLWRSVRPTAHGWRVWGGGFALLHTSYIGGSGGAAGGVQWAADSVHIICSNDNLFVMFFVLFKCLVVFIIFLVKTFEVVGTPGLLCMCVLKLGGGERCKGLKDSLSSGY